MKCVGLIRHGERAANAGEASLDHASTPLKPKGFKQARLVRRVIRLSPRSDLSHAACAASVASACRLLPSIPLHPL